MPQILLSELLGQLRVCRQRYSSLEMALHGPDKEKAEQVRASRRRLADRIRVLEDRIIEYEPESERAVDRTASGVSQSEARPDAGRAGGTRPAPGDHTREESAGAVTDARWADRNTP